MRPTSIQTTDFCRTAKAKHGGHFHREEERTGGINQHLLPPSADKGMKTVQGQTHAYTHKPSLQVRARCSDSPVSQPPPVSLTNSRWSLRSVTNTDQPAQRPNPETKQTPPPPSDHDRLQLQPMWRWIVHAVMTNSWLTCGQRRESGWQLSLFISLLWQQPKAFII